MTPYGPGEAREWALANMHGQCGCVMPTFRADLRGINERAIRHDVALEKRYGMTGVLIVSECGTTFDELKQVTDIIVDAAADDLTPSRTRRCPRWRTTSSWCATRRTRG